MGHRISLGTTLAAFILIWVGGLVTSTGSGMASHDPVAIEGFTGTKLYENGHRVLGWIVGALVFITLLTIGLSNRPTWMRRLALLAFVAVAAQGLLGMLTVRLELQMPIISIIHAGLAQITFSLLVALAIVTHPTWSPPPLDRLARATVAVIFVQILLGAWYRHTDNPLALGAHLLGILAVAAHVFRMKKAWPLHATFFLQLILGPLALVLRQGKVILAEPGPLSRALPLTAHVAAGALMMAAAVWVLLRPKEIIAHLATDHEYHLHHPVPPETT